MKISLFSLLSVMLLIGCMNKSIIKTSDHIQGQIATPEIQKMLFGIDVIFSQLHPRTTVFYTENHPSPILDHFIKQLRKQGYLIIKVDDRDKINYIKINFGVTVNRLTDKTLSLSISTSSYVINQLYDSHFNKLGVLSIHDKGAGQRAK